jgi:hypothetical protein
MPCEKTNDGNNNLDFIFSRRRRFVFSKGFTLKSWSVRVLCSLTSRVVKATSHLFFFFLFYCFFAHPIDQPPTAAGNKFDAVIFLRTRNWRWIASKRAITVGVRQSTSTTRDIVIEVCCRWFGRVSLTW